MAAALCTVSSTTTDHDLIIRLEGSVSADNAGQLEEGIEAIRAHSPAERVVLDAAGLVYISSAGLRVLMRLLKAAGSLSLRNASPEVYDVFEMTGLTEIMDVRRAPREIDVSGREVVARGGQGTVYRLDDDQVVKLYRPGFSEEDIERERRYARAALVAGIPTALPFDTVRCGDSLGVVFEHAGETTLARAYERSPERFDELTERYVRFVRAFHAAEVPAGTFESIRAVYHQRADALAPHCTPEEVALLHSLVDCVPDGTGPIHGDLHPGNIMVQGDELLLIDMPEVTQGPTQIDVVNLFRDLVSAPKNTPESCPVSQGIPAELVGRIGGAFFSAYTGIADPEQLGRYFQGLGLLYAFSVVLTMGTGGDAVRDHIGPVIDRLLRGVVVPQEQVLRGMLAQMR